jgi:hypothetical protein
MQDRLYRSILSKLVAGQMMCFWLVDLHLLGGGKAGKTRTAKHYNVLAAPCSLFCPSSTELLLLLDAFSLSYHAKQTWNSR